MFYVSRKALTCFHNELLVFLHAGTICLQEDFYHLSKPCTLFVLADFHRCNKALSAKGQEVSPCEWYQKVYKSLCPMSWVSLRRNCRCLWLPQFVSLYFQCFVFFLLNDCSGVNRSLGLFNHIRLLRFITFTVVTQSSHCCMCCSQSWKPCLQLMFWNSFHITSNLCETVVSHHHFQG